MVILERCRLDTDYVSNQLLSSVLVSCELLCRDLTGILWKGPPVFMRHKTRVIVAMMRLCRCGVSHVVVQTMI